MNIYQNINYSRSLGIYSLVNETFLLNEIQRQMSVPTPQSVIPKPLLLQQDKQPGRSMYKSQQQIQQ